MLLGFDWTPKVAQPKLLREVRSDEYVQCARAKPAFLWGQSVNCLYCFLLWSSTGVVGWCRCRRRVVKSELRGCTPSDHWQKLTHPSPRLCGCFLDIATRPT